MAATHASSALPYGDPAEYRRRVRAWTMYDWANSAFATTILAAVLPVYYSQVAGATLPSEATATAYWSIGLSISLFISAILSPILGTISDVVRGKKRFLAFFTGVGVVATGLLVLVETGDWMLASILFIAGRIGFVAAYTFYDSLLPHVAKPEDQDSVSARGYAMGYLGGGLLLAVNVVMIFLLPGTWGPRLSFLSVAIWWAVFSIPIFRRVPEPQSATDKLAPGENVIGVSFRRLWHTFRDISRYRELFKYLIAFLIYNDAIGTIIGVAAIYGAELGFGSVELILALLLVQFVGIPFALIFGRLPNANDQRRPFFLAFIIFNLVMLPLVGIIGRQVLPQNMSGAPQPDYAATDTTVGQGLYRVGDPALQLSGDWQQVTIAAADLGTEEDARYAVAAAPDARLDVPFYGQQIELYYSTGPDHGIWSVLLDGAPLVADEDEGPLTIDVYSPTVRYGTRQAFSADEPGEHILTLVNTGTANPEASGLLLAVESVEVLPPVRQSSLPVIIGLIAVLELIGLLFAWLTGKAIFARLANTLDTRRSILLSLVVYTVIAIWGYFVDSTVEFWFLAWMVAIVQGGSQALSRSLYASMSPKAKSGEFFGLYGIMEKFSSIIGPLLFALAVATFGSSRPAIVSLVAFFIIGGYLLTRVNITEGQRVAREEDAAWMGAGGA
jgi:UMF1 family MFS transporter